MLLSCCYAAAAFRYAAITACRRRFAERLLEATSLTFSPLLLLLPLYRRLRRAATARYARGKARKIQCAARSNGARSRACATAMAFASVRAAMRRRRRQWQRRRANARQTILQTLFMPLMRATMLRCL